MSISGAVQLNINLTEVGTGTGLETPSSSMSKQYPWSIANGTGVNQCDLKYAATRTLAGGANEDLDLSGALTTLFGTMIAMIKLRFVYVKAADANPGNLTFISKAAVGAPLFLALADGIVLEPGADFLYRSPKSGKTIVAATADILNMAAAAGGSCSYDIVILGTSA
jgi:hypothetical protein